MSMTNETFERIYIEIKDSMNNILDSLESKKNNAMSFKQYSETYGKVYKLCTMRITLNNQLKSSSQMILYDRYQEFNTEYLYERVIKELKKSSGDILLGKFIDKWNIHKIFVRWASSLFSYIDRYYVVSEMKDSLKNVGYNIFKEHVYNNFKKTITQIILDKMKNERDGNVINREFIKNSISIYDEICFDNEEIFNQDFLDKMIHDTSIYYKLESNRYTAEISSIDYIDKINCRMEGELNRLKHYFNDNTVQKIMKIIENELIIKHLNYLFRETNTSFIELLKHNDVNNIRKLYQIVKRVDRLNEMANMMFEHVSMEGKEIIYNYSNRNIFNINEYIDNIITIHHKYKSIIEKCYDSDTIFINSLTKSFESFINSIIRIKDNDIYISEILSLYCNDLVSKNDDLNDELDEKIDNIVNIIKYIIDKDIFVEHYRRLLSRRLLVDNDIDNDIERALISKLKLVIGPTFTLKLEGMIKDKILSQEYDKGLSEYLNKNNIVMNISFTPNVLNLGYWPLFKVDNIDLPEEFTKCINNFTNYYNDITTNRQLKWLHMFGTCQLLGRYSNGDKDIILSTYQAAILLLFNKEKRMSLDDIVNILKIDKNELKKNLDILTLNKKRKLLNNDNDIYSVNEDFKSKFKRIKITNIVRKIDNEERKNVNKTTEEDRKFSMEAAIIRIMKSRKILKHAELIIETSKQLMQYFKPQPKMIKRRIEELINREYLARDENDPTLYKYLA